MARPTTRPGRLTPQTGLGFSAIATRSTFSWIDSTSTIEETTNAQPESPHVSRSGHQLRDSTKSRLVRAMGPEGAATPDHPKGRRPPEPPRDDASHQPLQPTFHREHPADAQLPSVRLSPFRPPQQVPTGPTLSHEPGGASSTTTPNCRCRHPRPWVVTQLTPRAPAAARVTTSMRAAGTPTTT